ncbi:uncharacterized protein A1O9_12559 [Exophiala aquamarina CBS 119918]|uniref:Uncharacterized protein n=1 Tax=Exophiala aquamarina CBS 119918 TaxID=1182545 RepID=A0A072P741_9EURO|nr:uncharacterized protein A1O9_12559 [Exophiala aquamarina CBS 119918]KEF51410.1 hypothetical protein A1O9_12559 [Exophiala aquamarina CBS 119918]
MLATTPRAAARSTRALRARPVPIRARQPRNFRLQSTGPAQSGSEASGGASHALLGGVAGGLVAFLGGYLWYSFSGAKSVVNSVHQAKSYADSAFKKTTAAAPEPSEAIKWLRETITGYTRMIPGASIYVDKAFDDLDKVHEKHGDEVDKVINETYKNLKATTQKGFSVEAASDAWDILQDCLKRIGSLAGDAAQDILNNHPQLKENVGGKFEQLKRMGDEYGPEAKKQVDDTWKQAQDILKGGFSAGTLKKIQDLIQEKTQELKKYGDQAWQKGIEQAKPLLDKQPELKKLVEENKDKLLQGDLGQLWQKLQEAAKSGNTDDIQKFVKEQTDEVSGQAGSGIEQFLKMIPGGQELGPKLQQLQELSQKHGEEAERLLKSAIEDVKKVLAQKVEEGQKLKNKVEKDAKS